MSHQMCVCCEILGQELLPAWLRKVNKVRLAIIVQHPCSPRLGRFLKRRKDTYITTTPYLSPTDHIDQSICVANAVGHEHILSLLWLFVIFEPASHTIGFPPQNCTFFIRSSHVASCPSLASCYLISTQETPLLTIPVISRLYVRAFANVVCCRIYMHIGLVKQQSNTHYLLLAARLPENDYNACAEME